ncbi:hypothetical protein ACFL1L_03205 [Thermoplasmatota archaeon]
MNKEINDYSRINLLDSLPDDEIDQNNSFHDGESGNFLGPDQYLAQSFIPSKPILTRVKLLIQKYEEHKGIIEFSINNSLIGDSIVNISIHTDDLSEFNDYEFFWYEFDIPDIQVNTGEEYFIVCIAKEGNFGCATNILYEKGDGWGYDPIDDKVWLKSEDLCFITYGYGNEPPNKPIIDGPTTGKVNSNLFYTFSAIEPEGEDVYFYIDIYDGSIPWWVGPFESGEEYTLGINWGDEGTYLIGVKARDIHTAESEWATLEISIPKNKTYSSIPIILNWAIERFPLLQPYFSYLI